MGVKCEDDVRSVRVLIIGGGFAGLGMAAALHRSGEPDFLLLERADGVGGTWRDNVYPGCACDVPSVLYSYSFAPGDRWSAARAPQPEILRHLQQLAAPVRDRIVLGAHVTAGDWDERAARWRVRTADGRLFAAQFLVAATGALNVPRVPRIPGAETFTGPALHTAAWDRGLDVDGRRIAVIGTGASAVQLIPAIASRAAEVHVYQRTPAWVLPAGGDGAPRTRRFARTVEYWRGEAQVPALGGVGAANAMLRRRALRHLHGQVTDPSLRRVLTPDTAIGCKRILRSDTYFPALTRGGVDVVTAPIDRVADGAVVAGGVAREADVLVYATGFRVAGALARLPLTGRDGVTLQQRWSGGVRTHLGITVAGMPNLFLLSGPNTGLGHNSVLFMIESQIRYVLGAIELTEHRGAAALEVRPEAEDTAEEWLRRRLPRAVWSTGGCGSWYLDGAGRNHALWPGFSWRYRLRTRRVRASDHTFTAAPG